MLAIFAIGHWSYLQISSELRGRTLILPACAAFSCFADLALTSPEDYKLEGQGSLMQCVLTPADKFMPLTNEQICEQVDAEVTFQASFLPVRMGPSHIIEGQGCKFGCSIDPLSEVPD